MADTLSTLGDQLLSTLKNSLTDEAKKYIEENAPIKQLLEDRAKRAAELAKEYVSASDDDKPTISEYMSVVYQTVRNETVAVLLSAPSSVKDVVLAALQAVFQVVLQNLPTIIALIPK